MSGFIFGILLAAGWVFIEIVYGTIKLYTSKVEDSEE